MSIRTEEGMLEAYVFERHIAKAGIVVVREALARAPGVEYVAQFVGAFTLFARVVAEDLGVLQQRIAAEYFDAGVRSDWAVNLTAERVLAPKRHSPDICALVCVQATADPFQIIAGLDAHYKDRTDWGAAVVTARGFDLLVDLGAETVEDVIDRVLDLRTVPGVGRTSTALAALPGNAVRVEAG